MTAKKKKVSSPEDVAGMFECLKWDLDDLAEDVQSQSDDFVKDSYLVSLGLRADLNARRRINRMIEAAISSLQDAAEIAKKREEVKRCR